MADLEYDLEVNTGDSAAQTKALATALSGLSDNIREVGRSINGIANQAGKMERSLVGIGRGASKATSEINDLAAAQAKLGDYKGAASYMAKAAPDRVKLDAAGNPRDANSGRQISKKLILEEAQAQQEATSKIVAQLNKEEAKIRENIQLRKQLIAQTREARLSSLAGTPQAQSNAQTPRGAGSAQDVAQRFMANGAGLAYETAELKKNGAAHVAAAKATMDHMNRLTNLRYTLYDVQRTFLVAGLGLAAFNVITIKAAMDYETAMAQISRTSGIAGSALEAVRNQFIDLAQTIPTSFANLSEIGTLGGQLNIPAANLANFTKTVAQFTTTTNVAVEQSATAFGRLDALLPDVQGNYEALGSSILNVGINSVATETEIINTTNQIAAAGSQAGLAASEIIGLAASFASLGVAPEAARGTTIRFFSEINTALAEGGDNLEKFATLSGKSVSQFQSDWSQDAGGAFLELLDGMKQLGAEGTNVESVLRDMGITAVRDINALLKLSQNAEIVASNFGYAAEGFDEATQLGAAFEVQAATLASKLQVLANSVQAFFAEMGAGGIPVLGKIVDGLAGLVSFLTDLAKVPAVQYAAALVGGLTALTAVLSLVGFALARTTSATIAFRTAIATMRYEALAATGGIATLRAGVTGFTSSLFGANVAMKVFKGALISTGIGAVMVAAGFAIEGIVKAVDRLRPAAERAKEAFGDLSGLSDAIKDDTAVFEETGQRLGTVQGQLVTTKERTAEWARELNNATGSATLLDGAVEEVTASVEYQEYSIGRNTAAWIANTLAADESLAAFLKFASSISAKGGPQFDTGQFVGLLTKNDTDAALALVEQYYTQLDSYAARMGPEGIFAQIEFDSQIEALRGVVENYGGAVQGAATESEILGAVMDAVGPSAERTAQALGVVSDEADASVAPLQAMRDSIESAFAPTNLIAQMSQDFYDLTTGILESNGAIDAYSQSGMGNLANFQQSIGSVIAAGESMGISSTQSVAAFFSALQQQGIDTANLLAQLANVPGISTTAVQQSINKLNPKATVLASNLGKVANEARSAGRALGGGGGDSTAGGAGAATEKIRTLLDYASDLSGVFKRAFEIRFSSDAATDTIASGWQKIADETSEALKNIREIQTELTQLASDKSINQYFLGIAETYGDTLRAADIRGKLAEIDDDMAEAQEKLGDEQAKTNKTLVGNTAAAIENRKTITGLVQNYESLIESYAASGMDQAQLAVKTAELKAQFIAQATQLGYNTVELDKYAVAFDDVALAIQRVPRNISVTANLNPALQALAEFEARAAQSGAAAGRNYSGGFSAGASPLYLPDPYPNGYEMARKWKNQWNEATQTWQTRDPNTGAWIKTGVQLYKTGGYTGDASPGAIAGLVHGKEFVVNAENTAKFRPILEAMNKGQMPVMAGATSGANSGVSQMVELSPYDRKLLAAAGNVGIFIDGKAVAGAVNGNNQNANTRGAA